MLIDLDAAPPPDRPRPKRHRGRLLKPVLSAALLLLLVGGAASPQHRREIAKVADTGGFSVNAYQLTATALYTARLQAGVDGSVVEAVPLVPGGPRWRVAVVADQPALTMDDAGTTVVVWPGQQGRITFVDARTGKVRWRTGEYAVARLVGDRVVYWSPNIEDDRPQMVRMADLATGRVLWERAGEALSLDADPRRRMVLSIDQGGMAAVYSADDGHVLAGGRDLGIDPYEWGIAEDQGASSEAIVGDTLYLHSQQVVAAYRLRDLKPLWRAKVAEPEVLGACGALICTTGWRGLTALDPATGTIRWASQRWRSITPGGMAVAGDLTTARLDPADGRVVEELGRGAAAGDLLLRNDRGRTWITGLADREIIGVLPLIVSSMACTAAGDYLACPAEGQSVTVWRVT